MPGSEWRIASPTGPVCRLQRSSNTASASGALGKRVELRLSFAMQSPGTDYHKAPLQFRKTSGRLGLICPVFFPRGKHFCTKLPNPADLSCRRASRLFVPIKRNFPASRNLCGTRDAEPIRTQ